MVMKRRETHITPDHGHLARKKFFVISTLAGKALVILNGKVFLLEVYIWQFVDIFIKTNILHFKKTLALFCNIKMGSHVLNTQRCQEKCMK